jgi:hypothetical protein
MHLIVVVACSQAGGCAVASAGGCSVAALRCRPRSQQLAGKPALHASGGYDRARPSLGGRRPWEHDEGIIVAGGHGEACVCSVRRASVHAC